ncbi:hypothetical protein V5O48_014210 [Marasmius crinis-equi]|uniref:DUF6535 domain-containing protein n=1 Tax=Marasmius crinis-equi TaxID=585013 RepID=A0ABR3EXX3_9AGAR
MASKPTTNVPTDDFYGAKVVSSPERSVPEDRSQSKVSLLQSKSDGTPGQDVHELDPAGKTPLGPGASLTDGPGDAARATEGTDRDTAAPASRTDLDAQDGGAGKTTKLATSAKERIVSLDGHLDHDEKGGAHSVASPTPAAQKPTLEESWKTVMKEIGDIDDAQYMGWDDDINTLLVFAGLFSAVVTAFTIESYQWLSEDLQDTTVTLLMQISQQMGNKTMVPTSPEPFKASSSVVRINTFWFLSLIISLIDALFGLLCKQWLREHRRPTHTRTPQEVLALHWLRRKSLEKWHVPTFIATLPMLLELALFFFFAGLLELLWSRHSIPFTIATVVVGVAALFYIGTTILPGFNIIHQAWQVVPEIRKARAGELNSTHVTLIPSLPPMEFICPYKSPQAWVTFKAVRGISSILFDMTNIIVKFLNDTKILRSAWYRRRDAAKTPLNNLIGWPSVDLEIIQRSSVKLAPPFYELKALRWLVQELQDTPSMIPHLQNTLGTLPLHLVMPAVFDQWLFLLDRDWTIADIETALQPAPLYQGVDNHLTELQSVWLEENSKQDSKLFRQFLHYHHILVNWRELREYDWNHLVTEWEKIWRQLKLSSYGDRVGPPFSFHMLDRILRDPGLDKELFKPWLSEFCTMPSTSFEQYPLLIDYLARHITTISTPQHPIDGSPAGDASLFFKSEACRDLMKQLHNNLLANKEILGSKKASRWQEATDIIRHIHALPLDYFPLPLPGHFPIPLSKLKDLLWELPEEPSKSDFGFLDSYQKHWEEVSWHDQVSFIEILSRYIIEYQNPRVSHNKHNTYTPLATHRKGLKFIGFLYAQWEALYRRLDDQKGQRFTEAWQKALEHVRAANGIESSDELEAMFTPLSDSSSDYTLLLLDGIPSWREEAIEMRARLGGRVVNEFPSDELKVITAQTSDYPGESPLTDVTSQTIQEHDMNAEVHSGRENEDSAVPGPPNGAGASKNKEVSGSAVLTGLAEESRDSGGGAHNSREDNLVGGVGADNNV